MLSAQPDQGRLRSQMSDMNLKKIINLEELDFEKISHAHLAESTDEQELLKRSQTERVHGNSEVKMIDTQASTNDDQVKSQSKLEIMIDEEDDSEMTHEEMKAEIRNMWNVHLEEMLVRHIQDKREQQSKVVHEGVACDGCKMFPIVGIRYKCSVREDFDLC